jgi:hypothetical protein
MKLPSITLNPTEHQALMDVVFYLMENESNSCEEFVASGGDRTKHIYHKAYTLLQAINN